MVKCRTKKLVLLLAYVFVTRRASYYETLMN